MMGRGAVLQNGRVEARWIGVQLDGEGGHTVQQVQIDGAPSMGIYVVSANNRIRHNRMPFMSQAGIIVESDQNVIVHNVVEIAHDIGYHIMGHHNVVRGNIFKRGLAGILVDGDGNELRRNTLGLEQTDVGSTGMHIDGAGNVIIANVIRNFDLDLGDVHGECKTNTYVHNNVEHGSPPCVIGRAFRAEAAFASSSRP